MFYHFIFGIKQSIIKQLKLTLEECLILNFLYMFFNVVGSPLSYSHNGIKHFWVSYDIILQNLPILGNKKKKIRVLIDSLHQKGVISKVSKGNKIFININTDCLLFGESRKYEFAKSRITKVA